MKHRERIKNEKQKIYILALEDRFDETFSKLTHVFSTHSINCFLNGSAYNFSIFFADRL